MRRIMPALALLLLTAPVLAAPVLAAENAPEKDAAGKEGGAPGTNVDMPFLMAPMKNADGKLSGYAYIGTRLTATSNANALLVRDRIAFVQDAFVRDVNGASVAKPDDLMTVDQPALQARLLGDAKRIMGAAKVASIAIVQVQIAPLHPTQTPALNTPAPDQAADAAKPAPEKTDPKAPAKAPIESDKKAPETPKK